MRRWVLVLALGCGDKHGPAKPVPKTRPYLLLFEQGRTWTLPSAGGTVRCKVAESKEIGDSVVSRLDCGALLVSGTWVSTPAGLYHPYLPVDEPDELALLGEDDLLIAAIPAEREHSHVLQGGAQDSIEAFGFDGSWCVRQTTQLQGEYRTWLLCVDGTNITGGGEVTGSGTERHAQWFGKVPSDTEETDD